MHLLAKLDLAVTALETSEVSLEASRLAARVLESVVHHGWNTFDALQDVFQRSADENEKRHISIALRLAEEGKASQKVLNVLASGKHGTAPMWAVKAELGLSCHLPGSIRVALGIAAAFGAHYEGAIKANILVGGDSCARAIIIGALCAASNHSKTTSSSSGVSTNVGWALPPSYRSKVHFQDRSEQLIAKNDALFDKHNV